MDFIEATKKIKSPMDMGKWMKSSAYSQYVDFLTHLSQSVHGIDNQGKNSSSCNAINAVIENLNQLNKLVAETPPAVQPQRFGNPSFRNWFDKMNEQSKEMCEKVLPYNLKGAAIELAPYWLDSFGNKSRIDYGTGHEMSFLIYLLCLNKLGVFRVEGDSESEKFDYGACLVNQVFVKYMDVVRTLQKTYQMEPAGSHGVYSLDDYQFLPFYFGSSQLDGSKLEPKDIPEMAIMTENKSNYLFCAAIDYINQVKTGPFSEHSNQLWNISAVPAWKKVNEGLMKMYKAEVLSKFPIIQHVLFGSLFSLD